MSGLDLLSPDCSRCSGLCCTVLPYSASADFAESKPAGRPCQHLGADFGCGIHTDLVAHGWRGCTVFECFGAGQLVTQQTFGGRTWRDSPDEASAMFHAFVVVMGANEVRHHLRSLGEHPLDAPTRERRASLSARAERLATTRPDALTDEALAALRAEAGQFFVDTSSALRSERQRTRTVVRTASPAASPGVSTQLAPYADLAGADLRHAGLDAADLRGATLIAADLRGARLTLTDLLGADLRDARLDGADLSVALFLTQPQLNAAAGDLATAIPAGLRRPRTWR